MATTNLLGSVAGLTDFIESGHIRYSARAVVATHARSAGRRWFSWHLQPNVGDLSVTPEEFTRAVYSLDLGLDMDIRSFRDGLDWLSSQPFATRLSIPISPSSLDNRLFARHVIDGIDHHPLVPEQLCFSIDVVEAISNLSSVTFFVREIRQMGCKVSLTNGSPGNPVLALFGPLGYLDYLEIGERWVGPAPTSQSHRNTLESLVEYAQRMGLRVIADGVDTNAHKLLLTEFGVDFLQGEAVGAEEVVSETFGKAGTTSQPAERAS